MGLVITIRDSAQFSYFTRQAGQRSRTPEDRRRNLVLQIHGRLRQEKDKQRTGRSGS